MIEWSAESLGECVAHAVRAEVDDRAAAFLLDHLHGLTQQVPRRGRVVGARAQVVEDIAQQVAPVDADEGGVGCFDGVAAGIEGAHIADGQGEVRHGVDHGAEGDEVELTVRRVDLGALDGVDA